MAKTITTSTAALNELCSRIKNYRININMTQQELSFRSGVSLRNISRFENGGDIQFSNLFKILQALQLDGNLTLLVPDVTIRPSAYLIKKPKQRAGRKIQASVFKWGDDL